MKFVVIAFALCYLIQQFYYWIINAPVAFRNFSQGEMNTSQPVSVVICGKNEENNIKENLPKILAQHYPKYEVIFVDDHSTDQTEAILKSLQAEYSNLRLIPKEEVENRPGKKAALYTGVENAKYDTILVTDADCVPSSIHWIARMMGSFETDDQQIVLGIGPNFKENHRGNKFFRYETVWTFMSYVGYWFLKQPYMGVGRNMAFRKQFFISHFTLILQQQLASGDDDLFINSASTRKNTNVCTHKESLMFSNTPKTIPDWVQQKTRHLSVGTEYKIFHQIGLSIFPIAYWGVILTSLVLFTTPLMPLVILFFILDYGLKSFINGLVLQKIDQMDIHILFPFYQFIWVVSLPFLWFKSQSKQKTQWN